MGEHEDSKDEGGSCLFLLASNERFLYRSGTYLWTDNLTSNALVLLPGSFYPASSTRQYAARLGLLLPRIELELTRLDLLHDTLQA